MKRQLKDGYTIYKGVTLPDSANEMRKLERNMRRANSLSKYVKHEREVYRAVWSGIRDHSPSDH